MTSYLYAASAAASAVCGTVFGVRRRSFKGGLTAALICATAISCFLSLRYAEIAIFWLLGSPAAGLRLLGTICLIPLPWLLFPHDKKSAVASVSAVAAAAAFLWIIPSHFPFPLVYASAIFSAATRIALELRADHPHGL
ncbi:hypothetical protein [Streptomyces sp. NPDC046985]|uniref:hypothetical protein n=1 Tax=Streptomyces sp. NPDC046985 TaxID=3155377 RepID=UPI0033D536AE